MGLPKLEHLPHYTYTDYSTWEGNWELLNGIPYAMTPAPSVYHQEISGNLYMAIRQALQNCSHCKALLPVDWKISEDTVVQPDISISCHAAEAGIFITKAPAVIFEILSPSTAQKDRTVKFDLYESEGVTYYVLIDPKKQQVEVFRLREGRYEKVIETREEVVEFDLTAEAHCSFLINFSHIW